MFMIGDILQFASLAYFFCALLHKFRPRFILLILITSVVWWISPYTWGFTASNYSIFNLFTGVPPQVFFPVFPWLFFPMLGLVFGRLLQLHTSIRLLKAMILTGILLLVLGKLMTVTEPVEWNDNFYRQGRGGTLFHAGVALLWTALFIGIAQLKTSNLFSGYWIL